MDANELASWTGIVLSLIFSYIPGLKDKWDALPGDYKRLYMAGMLLLTALAVVGIACSGFGAEIGITVTCNTDGIAGVLRAFVVAVIANQATFVITKG